jgi:CRP/FNR family transcriptional regulator, anaerobic regulatory protein
MGRRCEAPSARAALRAHLAPLEANVADSARFALHRPEFLDSLVRGEEKIAQLMSGSAAVQPAGKTLIAGDSEHPYVYRLKEGWAGRLRQLTDGRYQFILVFLPGDLFAVKSMFVTRHPDDVKVLSKAVIERVDYRVLHSAYISDGDVASRCTWQILEEERRLHNWVVGLGQGNAGERLALLLIDFHGRLVASGSLAPDARVFHMPLTQVHLAAHLGLTAVHVNRVLRGFRENEIVDIRDGRVSIGSLERLAEVAHPLLDSHERSAPEFVGNKSESNRRNQQ